VPAVESLAVRGGEVEWCYLVLCQALGGWFLPFHSKSSGAVFILAKPKDSGLSTSCQKLVWNLWAYRALFIVLTVA